MANIIEANSCVQPPTKAFNFGGRFFERIRKNQEGENNMKRETFFKLLGILGLAALVVITSPRTTTDEVKRIGILQLAEHLSLDAAREGFISRLEELGYIDGENIQINYFNAQGDQSNLRIMSQQLVSQQSDLVLAIATSAAQAIANETSTIPILTSAVTSLETANLVESNERPNTNVSGTSDMPPIEAQLNLLRQLAPNAQTIGFIYNTSEPNSQLQVEIAEAIAIELGFIPHHMSVTSTNDVAQNMLALATRVDVMYIPTDNTMSSASATVGNIARQHNIPIVTGSVGMMREGGLATIGIDYFELGQQTADMAVRVFNGEDISTMPVEFSTQMDLFINEEMAEAIGIQIPASLRD